MRLKRLRRLLSATLLAAAGLAIAPAAAEESMMLVLDASGSMAGEIDGAPKLDIARATIRDLVAGMDPHTRLGLVAYGHRRKGDCGDIETIYPVGSPEPEAIMRAIGNLRAVGKTPLSAAVRQAAEQLRYTEDRATVILVSDGLETCQADPCALARELEANGIDFAVHVIGFDVNREERAGLQCLADLTGGEYIAANDAASLQTALRRTVEVAQAPAPAPVPQPVPAQVVEAPAFTGLRVNVVISEGGESFDGDLGLKIVSAEADFAGNRKTIAEAWRTRSGHIFENLPGAAYLLEVVLPDSPHITATVPVTVAGGQAETVTVNLDIGRVRLDASLSEGGKPFGGDLGWKVLSRETDLSGKRTEIANFWRAKSGNVFWLPAGTWRLEGVIADAGYLTVASEITVEPGGAKAHGFSFNAGTVRFDAALSAEGKPFGGDIGWTVLSKETDLSGNRTQIANFWRVRSGGIFLLPAGDWLVEGVLADHGHVTTRRTISVAPGSEKAHGFNFDAGTVRFDVTVDGHATDADLAIEVLAPETSLSGERAKIANFWRVRSGHIAILPSGTYLVTGRLADQQEVGGAIELEVAPGDEKPVAMDLTHA